MYKSMLKFVFLEDNFFVRIGALNLNALLILSIKSCASLMNLNIADDVVKIGPGRHFIESRQSVLIDQSIMNTFIYVFYELVQKKIIRVKKIGKWSKISEIGQPDSKLHGSLIKK